MGTKNYSSYSDMITFSRASTGTYLDSDGLLKSAATNTPRIEYDYQGNRLGLLVEEARTNLITHQTYNFTGAIFATDEANTEVVAPTGIIDGLKITPQANFGTHTVYYPGSSDASVQSYTSSVYVKQGNATHAQLIFGTSSGASGIAVILDFSTGDYTIDNAGTGYTLLSAGAENVGNGWYRLHVAMDATDTASYTYVGVSNGSRSWTATGAEYIYAWGGQREAGSFPTSYIPTTGATATRSADVASIGVGAFGYNKTAGTVLVEFDSASLSNSTIYSFDDGSSAQGNTALIYPANGITYQVFSVGSTAVNTTFDDYKTANKVSKVATCYRANDFAAVLNGGTIATDSSGALPTVTQLRLGNYVGGGTTFDMTGHISSIAYYPRRLTDAQIKALTSPPETPTLSLTFDDSSTSYLETSIHG